jgi:hypothetical protein
MSKLTANQKYAQWLKAGKTPCEIAKMRVIYRTAARRLIALNGRDTSELNEIAAHLCPLVWVDYYDALAGEIVSETNDDGETFPAFTVASCVSNETAFTLWRVDERGGDAIFIDFFEDIDAAKIAAETYLETLENEATP